ncbi:DUF5107 domain-containing protein [Candidatus Gracilibacteria bacterium]|nr:DUF5107 domain-containing protein [Candidatus Gracilibacteria bacterium]
MQNTGVRLETNWTYYGFRALVLENRYLRAVLLPDLGGKIWSLVDKLADRELLWHNPRVPPRAAVYGATYDDWFCGGWDDLFPNDAPTTVGGDNYPDHGELWALPFDWHVDLENDAAVVTLRRAGVVTTTYHEKRIVLRADEPLLRIRQRLHNQGLRPIDFLWKMHPALRVSPTSRIDLPSCTVRTSDLFNERLAQGTTKFSWPSAPGPTGDIDMRQIPPYETATCDFYYATELESGWCALTDTATQSGFGIAFDPAVFRSVWVFGAYGGWRGHYTTILEPCTGYPYRLEDAIAQGTASRLEPGATLETTYSAVLYRGVRAVAYLGADGDVR